MRPKQLSVNVNPALVREIRNYFEHEADKTYSDDAIVAAISWWLETRLENIYEEIGEVIMSPHLPESQHFRSILEKPELASLGSAMDSEAQVAHVEQPEPRASIFNGFRDFSPARLGAMIQHVARSGHDIYKTNLNKLLFYSDLTFYHLNKRGISGATYVNMPYGPVPDGVEKVIDELVAEGKLVRGTVQGMGRNVQLIKPGQVPEPDVLSADEKRIIDWVLERYGDLSPTEISDLSHSEKAYSSTRPGEHIAYEYSKFLQNLPSSAT